jgi:hypothetical protein
MLYVGTAEEQLFAYKVNAPIILRLKLYLAAQIEKMTVIRVHLLGGGALHPF